MFNYTEDDLNSENVAAKDSSESDTVTYWYVVYSCGSTNGITVVPQHGTYLNPIKTISDINKWYGGNDGDNTYVEIRFYHQVSKQAYLDKVKMWGKN